jgi:hypothetical protein
MNKEKYQNLDQYDLDECLIEACMEKDMELVKYLLTSPDLLKHADINTKSSPEAGLPLRDAFYAKHFEVAKFLLSSPELREHADIHIANDDIFKTAFRRNSNEVLESLVFDYKIERTDAIHMTIDNAKNTSNRHMVEYVEKMFRIRSLNNELNNELSFEINDETIKKTKI